MVTVTAGIYHSLGVRANGTVAGWGYNGSGQTVAPVMATNGVMVAAGEYHSAVLQSDGTVVAWGLNTSGQTNVPAGLSNVVAVAAGEAHTLALRQDGTVVAWGLNGNGQTNVPVSATNVLAVSAGAFHTVALRADGTLVAWGGNGNGQRTVPASATNVVTVAAGGYHTVALRGDGVVLAWGRNSEGQATVPASATNVVSVSAGRYHTLALRGDGTAVAWGAGTTVGSGANYGQSSVPTGLTNLASLAGGGYHSVALGVIPGNVGPQSFAAGIGASAAPSSPRKVAEVMITPAAGQLLANGATGGLPTAKTAAPTVTTVAGSGQMSAPAGVLAIAPDLAGAGAFEVEVRWPSGAANPAGGAAFTWNIGTGRYEIASTQVTHLQIESGAARIEGACAINGVGGFAFTLLVVPSRSQEGNETQRLRLQVRDATTGTVVLDTQPGTRLDAELEGAGKFEGRVSISNGPARE